MKYRPSSFFLVTCFLLPLKFKFSTKKYNTLPWALRGTVYKCKRCRSVLSSSQNILPHWPGEVTTWSSMLQRLLSTADDSMILNGKESLVCKDAIFVEPMKWMGTKICSNLGEDTIRCAKCEARLGKFSWQGKIACSCGATMTPGFLLSLHRLDKCTMHKEVEAVI